jgi:hypothetical protein
VLCRNGEGLGFGGDRSEARKFIDTGKCDTSKPPIPRTQDAIRAELIGSDTCIAGGITARGNTPILALCRKLIDAGLDPGRPLHAYRRLGTQISISAAAVLCITVRSIGEGARLTVEDRPRGGKPPRFIRYRPMPDRAEGSPSIAPFGKSDRAILGAAE